MARRFRMLAAIAALVTTVIAPVVGNAAGPVPVGSIGLGEAVFWHGGHVDWSPAYSLPSSPTNENLDRCKTVGPCFEYALTVEDEGATTLRVALDTPMRDDGFEWYVFDPSGARKARITNSNHFSREALIASPAAGVWRITVAPFSADDAPFRMRAKLEAEPHQPTPDEDGRLLPNLQVFRIWEFTFAAPVNPANGVFPPDDQNPPADVNGVHPVSCAADEVAEGGAKRCLRYSFGLANTGPGNFDIRYSS
ncbi:MAG TPA: hypothetical protein VM600_04320, partial [Actinomycetota bacterium]|nr:hypothetical protein [Actinomycetota bacterium]